MAITVAISVDTSVAITVAISVAISEESVHGSIFLPGLLTSSTQNLAQGSATPHGNSSDKVQNHLDSTVHLLADASNNIVSVQLYSLFCDTAHSLLA